MTRSSVLATSLLGLGLATAGLATAAPASMSASQLVDRNLAARGGLAAWRAVNTLTLEGKLDAGGKENHQLPFVMKLKRPHKSRLEITFKEQTSVQVWDGAQGWKLRPFLNRNDVDPFTPAEAKLAADTDELDGPLADYAAKGTRVDADGTDTVDGHPAYRLRLTSRSGTVRHLWLDAKSFLELKIDGAPRKLDGKMHKVAIYYRDFKVEKGLSLPRQLETAVEGVKQTYKMDIAKVTVNAVLDDALFQKPLAAPVAASAPAAPPAK